MHTYNNLNISILKQCSSWTSHIGDGVLQFAAIRAHLTQQQQRGGLRSLAKANTDVYLQLHNIYLHQIICVGKIWVDKQFFNKFEGCDNFHLLFFIYLLC